MTAISAASGQMMIILSTVVTAIRNLAFVVFTVEACWLAWRMLAVPGAGPRPP